MKLAAGDWTMALSPDKGGAIISLQWQGRDILRPTADGAVDPIHFSCFPLLPYANRIAGGRFSFEHKQISIPRNHPEQRHPLHGLGWLRPWQCPSRTDMSATLTHHHNADAHWPWSYRAQQDLTLDASGLSIVLTIMNTDKAPMPVSLGFHPYFEAKEVTELRFDAEAMWMRDDECLPTELAAADRLADWAKGEKPGSASLIDNSYVGWSQVARIGQMSGDIVLAGTHTPFLHIYAPPGAEFFCAEPTTAMPDAVHQERVDALAPGTTRTIAMSIRQAV